MKHTKQEWAFAGIVSIVLLGLMLAVLFIVNSGEEPARINVRCIGDHLLFESERTGDIQVIPNKCKKTYPRKSQQAPEGAFSAQ